MVVVDIHSASPLSEASSDELSKSRNAQEVGESISRGTSVSPGTTKVTPAGPTATETSTQGEAPTRPFAPATTRSTPRLSIRASISEAPLPWQVDETSSPFTPTSHGRRSSFMPSPPRTDRSKPDLMHASSSPAPSSNTGSYTYSPYSTTSSNSSPNNHIIDLSHPPGYAQNARGSFSDRIEQPAFYDNSTPFYQNNFNSYSTSTSTPATPTRRGRGILDNDPSLYLRGEADTEDETYWDTATRWAKAAGKRMSQGEQQLWRIVSSVTNGDDRYDR